MLSNMAGRRRSPKDESSLPNPQLRWQALTQSAKPEAQGSFIFPPKFLRPSLGLVLVAVVILFCVPTLPRASFTADDYRYFNQLERHATTWLQKLAKYSVIENRWDDNWWIAEGSAVRFFRPLMILSFKLDWILWGRQASGYVLTNILLHALATFLVWILLCEVSKSGAASWLAALAFGLHACHGENIWSISGRTDTITVILFLSTLLAYAKYWKNKTASARLLVWLFFLLALLAKEYNILLLVFFGSLEILNPGLQPGPPASRPSSAVFWAGCAASLLIYLSLREAAFSQSHALFGYPFPYFHLPTTPVFWSALSTTTMQYTTGITTGTFIDSFLADPQVYIGRVSQLEIILGTACLVILLLTALWSKAACFYAGLFLLPLLAVLPLYGSARFLYLPSVGYVGLLAVLLARLIARQRYIATLFFLGLLVVLPSARLYRQLRLMPKANIAVNEEKLIRAVQSLGLKAGEVQGVYFFDFPFSWLQNQFIQSTAEQALRQKFPPLRVLSRAGPANRHSPTQVKFLDAYTIELSRPGCYLYEPDPVRDFAERLVYNRQQIEEADYLVTVIESMHGKAIKVQVTFRKPIRLLKFYRFLNRDQVVRIG